MRNEYIKKAFSSENKVILEQILNIIAKYPNDLLTVRQIYYQLVSQDAIPNTLKEYKRTSRLINDARWAGIIDFDAIEDRTRTPVIPQYFEGLQDLVNAAINSYKRNRWENQSNYLEIWIEKDALSGIFSRYALEYDIVLQVNRGYSSLSAMHEAASRFNNNKSKNCYLLYFGDFDPSGEDMVRDIKNRLKLLEANHVEVLKIAILKEDIELYKLPPQPPKVTDPRSANFKVAHGDQAVELDALPIDVLKSRIESSIINYIDFKKRGAVIKREERDKRQIKNLV